MKYQFAVDKIDTTTGHGKVLSQIRPNSLVLECGCATGYITKFLKEQLDCKVHIVEFEKEAFDIAREFAAGGICADLNQESWVKEFEGMQFDYILFMDVLEHLYNPQEVLTLAEKMLKPDGSVLISLPNIAHNDVLINLYNNAFNYQKLGLLDNTHIRFFAKNNLSALMEDSGLRMVELDYTYVTSGRSELYWETPCKAPAELLEALSKRRYGDVYQFVVTAKKAAYCDKYGITLQEAENSVQTESELIGIQEIWDRYVEAQNLAREIESRYNELQQRYNENNQALLSAQESIQKLSSHCDNIDKRYEQAQIEAERKYKNLSAQYEQAQIEAESKYKNLSAQYEQAQIEAESKYKNLSAQYEQAQTEAESKCKNLSAQLEEAVNARQAAERMIQIIRQSYESMETHYNKIMRSRGWRFLNYLYDFRNTVLPVNSRRDKLVRALVRPILRLRRKIRQRRCNNVEASVQVLHAENSSGVYQPMPAEQAFEMLKSCHRIDIMAVGHTAYIAEMLQNILLDAGFESCIHLSELEQYEDIPYIMICPQNFKHFPAVYIAFQMEQTVSNRWLTDEYLQILRNAYAIFDYSLVNIKYFSNDPTLASKLYYLPVDVCKSMMQQHPDENEKEYDVLFYGAPFIERRQEFLKPISEKCNFCMIYDKFGSELYEQMKKAKIVVNVHFYHNALLETTRIYETLSVSDCLVISERSTDPKEEERLEGIVDFVEIGDVQGMLNRIAYWMEHEDERKEKVMKNRQLLKDRENAAKFYLYRFLLANECITFDRFYNSVGNYIHFDGNRVCLSLPESVVRREAFDADNRYGFECFPGLKHRLGWIGCGMSYKFIFRKAKEQKLEQILICEDDVYFPPDFDERFGKVLDYVARNDDWTVFSGIMADLGRVKPLKYEEKDNQEYIYLNKMISMVFNLYNQSIFEAISAWDNTNHDVQTNTIDRYLENREMRILTTCPFLVGHKEDLCSTIWGAQNTIYTELISNSSVKLREIVEKFKAEKSKDEQ